MKENTNVALFFKSVLSSKHKNGHIIIGNNRTVEKEIVRTLLDIFPNSKYYSHNNCIEIENKRIDIIFPVHYSINKLFGIEIKNVLIHDSFLKELFNRIAMSKAQVF